MHLCISNHEYWKFEIFSYLCARIAAISTSPLSTIIFTIHFLLTIVSASVQNTLQQWISNTWHKKDFSDRSHWDREGQKERRRKKNFKNTYVNLLLLIIVIIEKKEMEKNVLFRLICGTFMSLICGRFTYRW